MSRKNKRINVGIDIAKAKFDVCFKVGDTIKMSYVKTYSNGKKGFKKLLEDFSRMCPASVPYIGMESTGNYMRELQRFLDDNAISYVLLNARVVRHYSKFLNLQGKTDAKDSFMIASLISTYEDHRFCSSFSLEYETLQRHNAALKHVVLMKQRIKNFSHSYDYGEKNEYIETVFDDLNKEIDRAKDSLKKEAFKALVNQYPIVKDIKQDIKGVGESLLLVLVPQIFDSVGHFSKSQITAYIGMNPTQFQSGDMVYKDTLNFFGNGHIKRQLFMSALIAVRHNPILHGKYENLLMSGRKKISALAVIMRKILLAIISMIHKYKRDNGLIPVDGLSSTQLNPTFTDTG